VHVNNKMELDFVTQITEDLPTNNLHTDRVQDTDHVTNEQKITQPELMQDVRTHPSAFTSKSHDEEIEDDLSASVNKMLIDDQETCINNTPKSFDANYKKTKCNPFLPNLRKLYQEVESLGKSLSFDKDGNWYTMKAVRNPERLLKDIKNKEAGEYITNSQDNNISMHEWTPSNNMCYDAFIKANNLT
jgi:hypothetical protein